MCLAGDYESVSYQVGEPELAKAGSAFPLYRPPPAAEERSAMLHYSLPFYSPPLINLQSAKLVSEILTSCQHCATPAEKVC